MRLADTVSARHRLRGGPRAPVALVALAGVAVLIAGCGGGSSPGVASISSSSTSGSQSSSSPSRPSGGVVRSVGFAPSPAQRAEGEVAGLVFSRCMRSHGVPDFPDPPAASGGAIRFEVGSGGFDPIAPLFRKAQQTCSSVFRRRLAGAG